MIERGGKIHNSLSSRKKEENKNNNNKTDENEWF